MMDLDITQNRKLDAVSIAIGAGAALLASGVLRQIGGQRGSSGPIVPERLKNARRLISVVYFDEGEWRVTPELLDCVGLGENIALIWKIVGDDQARFAPDAISFKTQGWEQEFQIPTLRIDPKGQYFSILSKNRISRVFEYAVKIIDGRGAMQSIDPGTSNGPWGHG